MAAIQHLGWSTARRWHTAGHDLAQRHVGVVRAGGITLGTWAMFQMVLGVAWDVAWHDTIGRDSFWIAPHLLIYTSVTLAGAASVAALAIEWLAGRSRTPGFALAACGVATMLAAAPF